MVGGVAIQTYIPIWYKRFFDLLSLGDAGNAERLFEIIFIVLGLKFVNWMFMRVATFTNNFFQPRVMADLLDTCFTYLQHHSYNFFNNRFVGSLVRRVNRYERSFEDIADQIYWHVGKTTLKMLFVLGVLYFIEPVLCFILAGWAAAYGIFQILFSRFKIKYDIEQAAKDSKVSGYLADTISNNINLKIFTGFGRELKSFRKLTQAQYKIRKFSWDLGATAEAGQSILMIILEFVVIFVALRFWLRGTVTLGDIVLIQVYLIQIFEELWSLGRYIRRIYESMADAEEMTQILMTPYEVADIPAAGQLKVTEGVIAFRSVTFGYNQKQKVFRNFDLAIAPSEKVALIGPSGGGKTTIVKLLFRFMDIDAGKIEIDGQDIAKVTQESLRSAIAMVPQEPILFHRSLMENIRYAKPEASDAEVVRAAKLAHAHEFISSFPDGYNTYVGERGVKLSGGERQRVAIARAILKDAPILVLDEATSSLDSESEHYIQDALRSLMANKTTIVIAHRLSTIMQMNRIVVIDKGKIVEQGKHEELLKVKQGIYQKLWGIQAGSFQEV